MLGQDKPQIKEVEKVIIEKKEEKILTEKEKFEKELYDSYDEKDYDEVIDLG